MGVEHRQYLDNSSPTPPPPPPKGPHKRVLAANEPSPATGPLQAAYTWLPTSDMLYAATHKVMIKGYCCFDIAFPKAVLS